MYTRLANSVRRFVVFTEPHVADPAWMMPVIEVLPNGEEKRYSDASELFTCARKLRDDILRRQIEAEVRDDLLKTLGLTHDDYFAKLRKTCNPAESIYCGQCDDCKAHEAAENEGMGGD